MPSPKPITSKDNPRYKALLRLRKQRKRTREGLFIAEGMREVQRAVDAGMQMETLFVCPALIDGSSGDADAAVTAICRDNDAAPCFALTEPLFRKAAYRDHPQGVLAVFQRPERSLGKLLVASDSLWLIAVGLSKPGNLGAMARSASAFGAAGLITLESQVDALNPNAIRASTGAVFSIPVVTASWDELVAWQRAHAVRLFAALVDGNGDEEAGVAGNRLKGNEPNASGAILPCHHAELGVNNSNGTATPLAIVIGAEDTGLDDAWLNRAIASGGGGVSIPMPGHVYCDDGAREDRDGATVDSLNASNAAAILLYEAMRQRSANR